MNAQNLQDVMIRKQKELEEEFNHYKKLTKCWSRIDTTFKTISLISACLIATATTVTASISLPIFIPSILGALTAIQTSSCGLITIGFTSKKKSYYKAISNLIRTYLDKLFIFFERSKSDKIITIEELEEFNEIFDELLTKIESLKIEHKKLKKKHD